MRPLHATPVRWLLVPWLLVLWLAVGVSTGRAQDDAALGVARVIATEDAPPSTGDLGVWAARHRAGELPCSGPRARPRCPLHLVVILTAALERPSTELEIAIAREGEPEARARRVGSPLRLTHEGELAHGWSGTITGAARDARVAVIVRRRDGTVLARTVVGLAWAPPLPRHGCRGWTAAASRACRGREGGCALSAPLRCSGVALSGEELDRRRRQDAQQACVCVCERERIACAQVP